MNAGQPRPQQLVPADAALEGSRFVGEGGHFIDTLSALVGHDPVEVCGQSGTSGDRQVLLRYPDGSLGSITYATGGHRRFPKETFDVTGGGANGRLDNFTRVSVWTPKGVAPSARSWGRTRDRSTSSRRSYTPS